MHITISDFRECLYDFVEIYKGNNTQSERLFRKCGSEVPLPVSSIGPILVHFVTDITVSDKGFRINYKISGNVKKYMVTQTFYFMKYN